MISCSYRNFSDAYKLEVLSSEKVVHCFCSFCVLWLILEKISVGKDDTYRSWSVRSQSSTLTALECSARCPKWGQEDNNEEYFQKGWFMGLCRKEAISTSISGSTVIQPNFGQSDFARQSWNLDFQTVISTRQLEGSYTTYYMTI